MPNPPEIRLPDEPGPFREWLRTLPAEHHFGCRSTNCPLAEFLRSCGAGLASVGQYEYRTEDGDSFIATPAWVRLFVSRYDDGGKHTAADALRILASIEGAAQ